MVYQWHFDKKLPNDKARDPIQGQFFSDEQFDNPGEALIREGIQNSLDAARDEKVLIRIRLKRNSESIPYQSIAPFLEGLFPHLRSPGSGIRNTPSENEPCPILLFEDFGTTGLTGDPSQSDSPEEGEKNHFFHFFRAEGRSDKSGANIGRWGVGKHVFLAASRINSVFGYTIRADDKKKILMVMSVLKYHKVNETEYKPDGLLGIRSDSNPGALVLPIEDIGYIQEFTRAFDIQRGDSDPGLSIVVPWCDMEMTDECLIKAVATGYFWAILQGRLEVIIEPDESGNKRVILDKNSFKTEIQKIGGDLEKRILPLIDLSEWAMGEGSRNYFRLKNSSTWKWTSELFQEGDLEQIQRRIEDGRKIAIRVPVTIKKKKSKKSRDSFFDVFITRDQTEQNGIPLFVREGILIPKVAERKDKRLLGLRIIVVARENDLAEFLGDAENVAHTKWLKNEIESRDYDDGEKILKYIKVSASEIIRLLYENENGDKETLLSDIFYIEESDDDEKKKTKHGPKQPEPPGNPEKFTIYKQGKNCIIIKRGKNNLVDYTHSILLIQAAYNIRTGNPLSEYDPADFDFSDGFSINADGAQILDRYENILRVRITRPDFQISIEGFDPTRSDVYIRVMIEELCK